MHLRMWALPIQGSASTKSASLQSATGCLAVSTARATQGCCSQTPPRSCTLDMVLRGHFELSISCFGQMVLERQDRNQHKELGEEGRRETLPAGGWMGGAERERERENELHPGRGHVVVYWEDQNDTLPS